MYGDLAMYDAIHAANKINILNRPSRRIEEKKIAEVKICFFFHNAPPSVYRRLVPKISWTDNIDIKAYLSEHTFAKLSVRTRFHTEKSRWYILCFDFNTQMFVSLSVLFFCCLFISFDRRVRLSVTAIVCKFVSFAFLAGCLCPTRCVLLVSHIHKYTWNRIRLLTKTN